MHTETREAITIEHKGDKIFGILHRPINAIKSPAILFCQGFEGSKTGKLNIYVLLAQELTKRGFTVLRFDYRGTGDSEGDSKTLSFQDKVDDAIRLLEFMAEDPLIDSARIGIFGRSLGGAIALLAGKSYQKIKSFVLWAPVFNGEQWLDLWKKLRQNPSDLVVKEEMQRIPGEVPNEFFLKQLFALNVAEALEFFRSRSLLHIHGALDRVVNRSHSENYQKVCQDFSGAKFLMLPHSSHDFALSPDRSIAEKETVDWFSSTL
jgi:uncharacterized protein